MCTTYRSWQQLLSQTSESHSITVHVDAKDASGLDVELMVAEILSYLIIERFGDLRQVEKWLQLCTGGNLVKQGNAWCYKPESIQSMLYVCCAHRWIRYRWLHMGALTSLLTRVEVLLSWQIPTVVVPRTLLRTR